LEKDLVPRDIFGESLKLKIFRIAKSSDFRNFKILKGISKETLKFEKKSKFSKT
jgi:hypothetical protein